MSHRSSLPLTMLAALVGLLASVLVPIAPAQAATTTRTRTTLAAVNSLRASVKKLPDRSKAQRAARAKAVTNVLAVRKQVKRGKLCQAKTRLKAVRRALRTGPLRKIKPQRRTSATAAAIRVEGLILSSPAARKCGGAKTAPVSAAAVPSVLSSTPRELTVKVALPALQVVGKSGGGKAFSQITMAGLSTSAVAGVPGVPTLGQSFAIPEGATAKVDSVQADSYTLSGVDLYPAQQQPVDAADPFGDRPFVLDSGAYSSGKPFPAAAAGQAELGELRDIKIGQLAIAGAQYTAKSKKLKVFTSVTVKLSFPGSSGVFGGPGVTSAWNTPFKQIYSSAFVNSTTVADHLSNIGALLQPCGEQMLIVTSPALRTAADKLAAARNARGIYTKVVETGTGANTAGSTAADIRTYVQAEVAKTNCIRPSYLVLFGNTAQVPTFVSTAETTYYPATAPGKIASDFDYALKYQSVYLPDLAAGRIPAATLAEANIVVDKIIGYEDSPPLNEAFYQNATVTSYFQDDNFNGTVEASDTDGQEDRGFVQLAETVRSALIANGKSVSRVYTTDAGVKPKKFNDGSALPSELKKPTFAWNGTDADVISQVNAGRFLVLSRDHGWPGGVAHPTMDFSTVNALTNGALLPVLLSVNCSTGQFDDPGSPSFVERWLTRSAGGAVGGIGASRESPSEVNNRFALGLVDAIYPSTLPYAGSSTSVKTMGDVLNLGKLHTILDAVSIADFYGRSAASEIRDEQRLYNYFGDPSMPIRTVKPQYVKASTAVLSGATVRAVFSADAAGGVATVLENGVPIGKALVGADGVADIDPTITPGRGALQVVLNKDGVDPIPAAVRDALKPNLVVDSLSYVSSNVAASRWELTVRNAGTASTDVPVDISWTQSGGRLGTDGTLRTAAALAPGESVTLSFVSAYANPTATVVVDPANAIDESNESDNTRTATVPAG